MTLPIRLPTKVIYLGKRTTLLRVSLFDEADQPDEMPGWSLWRAMWRPSRTSEESVPLMVTFVENKLTVEVDEPTSRLIGLRGGVWDVKATSPSGESEVFFTADTAAEMDVTRP